VEKAVHPPACAILSELYGKECFPAKEIIPSLRISALVAACWPEQSAEVFGHYVSMTIGINCANIVEWHPGTPRCKKHSFVLQITFLLHGHQLPLSSCT
jgi:hypothetical protein